MKKVMFLIVAVVMALSFTACEKGGGSGSKHCWEFTMVTKGEVQGMPEANTEATTKTTQCDLTEAEADDVVRGMNVTGTSVIAGMTVTTTSTATKRKL